MDIYRKPVQLQAEAALSKIDEPHLPAPTYWEGQGTEGPGAGDRVVAIFCFCFWIFGFFRGGKLMPREGRDTGER